MEEYKFNFNFVEPTTAVYSIKTSTESKLAVSSFVERHHNLDNSKRSAARRREGSDFPHRKGLGERAVRIKVPVEIPGMIKLINISMIGF